MIDAAGPPDALGALRAYRQLAPWTLRELTAVAAAILTASGAVPLSAAARQLPTERTIRFYVTRGLVSAPEGRGTAAAYGYRHLVQVLQVKLRQTEGATLEAIAAEMGATTGDVLERRVAAAIGTGLPDPRTLELPRRRRGAPTPAAPAVPAAAGAPATWRHLPLAPGVVLLVDARHALVATPAAEAGLVTAARHALDEASRSPSSAGGSP